MRIFGFEVARRKAQTLTAVNSGWLGLIREPFAGAWQRNIEVDSARDLLAFSAVFTCATIIASDIAKLRIKLVQEDNAAICTEVARGSPCSPLR